MKLPRDRRRPRIISPRAWYYVYRGKVELYVERRDAASGLRTVVAQTLTRARLEAMLQEATR